MIPVTILQEQIGAVTRQGRYPRPQSRNGRRECFRLGLQGLFQDGAVFGLGRASDRAARCLRV
jgi:hypothetical protein